MGAPTLTSESTGIQYLRLVYPQLKPLFDAIGNVEPPAPSERRVADAVTRYIVGQMLSSKAARAIHLKVLMVSKEAGCNPWRLHESRLLECGLSRRKVRAIREFGQEYDARPEEIELWRSLPYQSLKKEVGAFWGLSDWTAAMLAIFHFGHTDIFPLNDGSISRVVKLIEDRFLTGAGSFDATAASPFGTQLAMILWASLDRGYWLKS